MKEGVDVRWVQLSFPRTDEQFLPEFQSRLYRELEQTRAVLHFQVREEEDRWYRHFYCLSWPRQEHTLLTHEAWLSALAGAVRAYISTKEEKLMYQRIVQHECYGKIKDKIKVLRYVFEYLQGREEEYIESMPHHKHRIEQEAVMYLENENVLRLDGFFRFRLREYIQELCAMVDLSVEQYIVEEEQEALIQKLRSFLSAFPRRSGLLRLVHVSRYRFVYYNEAWETLSPPISLCLPLEVESPYAGEEENLIGTLAGFAPERIIIYTRQPSHGLIVTLQRIFAERLLVCTEFSFPVYVGPDT